MINVIEEGTTNTELIITEVNEEAQLEIKYCLSHSGLDEFKGINLRGQNLELIKIKWQETPQQKASGKETPIFVLKPLNGTTSFSAAEEFRNTIPVLVIKGDSISRHDKMTLYSHPGDIEIYQETEPSAFNGIKHPQVIERSINGNSDFLNSAIYGSLVFLNMEVHANGQPVGGINIHCDQDIYCT